VALHTVVSSIVVNIIQERDKIFDKSVDTIIYVYKQQQPLLQKLAQDEPKIIFLDKIEEAENHFHGNTLLVLDDQLIEASGQYNNLVKELFIVNSHHKNMASIILLQNLFEKNLRLLAINSLYLIVLKSPRDLGSIINLSKQFCPKNSGYLLEAYKAATKKPYGYLFFDFTQQFSDKYRVRNSISFSKDLEFYVQKESSCKFNKNM